jgi:hypothetical protein
MECCGMSEHVQNVRNPSSVVHVKKRNPLSVTGPLTNSLTFQGEFEMSTPAMNSTKIEAVDGRGRLLVFAAPLVAGFRGAPLALSAANSTRRGKITPRKNWAKRRAFGA